MTNSLDFPSSSGGISPGTLLHEQRFLIRQKLGQGGMGAVYLADDTRLPGRQVAVKENQNTDLDAQAQFRREALLLARLRHPNLPQVTDYFIETNGKQYLVMDYVPGENLAQLMRQHQGPLPVEEVLAAMEQVMRALHYMHTWRDLETGTSRPIVHRDIKPANIKRMPDGRVVLVDFGIAKIDGSTSTATAVSARALTPGFAPIEQYHGGTDERSDIYSLGATIFALLSGTLPPSATSMASGMAMPSIRTVNQAIPERYAKVVERAMKLQAKDRYQSIAEMYQATFGKPIGGATGYASANPLPAAGAPAAGAAGTARRRGALVTGLAAAALVLAAVLWYFLVETRLQPPGTALGTPTAVTALLDATSVPITDGTAPIDTAALDTAPVGQPPPTATPVPQAVAGELPAEPAAVVAQPAGGGATVAVTLPPLAPTPTVTATREETAANPAPPESEPVTPEIAAAAVASATLTATGSVAETAATPTATATELATTTPTATPAAAETATATSAPSATATPSPTATATTAAVATETPAPPGGASATAEAETIAQAVAATLAAMATANAPTPTTTPTALPTVMPTATPTATSPGTTAIPSQTPLSPANTPAPTATPTPTRTSTRTPVPPTSTSAPTATRTPTRTPSPTPLAPTCTVLVPGLNLRSGPGTNYTPPIGNLTLNSTVRMVARNADSNWLQIETIPPGKTGWVAAAAQFVDCTAPVTSLPLGIIPPTPTPTATPTSTHTPQPTPTREPTATREATPTSEATPTTAPTTTGNNETFLSYVYCQTPADGSPCQGIDYNVRTATNFVEEANGYAIFRNYFYLRLRVNDPSRGSNDGDGVDSVYFRLRDEFGDTVDERREGTAGYCSFGGGEPTCNVLELRAGAQWPNSGREVRNGTYVAEIEVYLDGDNAMDYFMTVDFIIDSSQLGNGGNGGGGGGGETATPTPEPPAADLVAYFAQIGPGSGDTTVQDALVFQVIAYDPNRGSNDGDGINDVEMRIFGPNGDEVYQRTEGNPAYCAFAGGEPDCNIWNFNEHSYEWPSGSSIQSGQHRLEATANAEDGRRTTISQDFYIP